MVSSSGTAKALAAEWDERYTQLVSQLPGGVPNEVLIDEIGQLEPGRALDIGCGVGSDAIWLARQGWSVTAIDVSQVALDHAAGRARQASVRVQWLQSRLEDVPIPSGGFDLVTAFHPALRHSEGRDAQTALLASVAPGGTLLVVHHADIDVQRAKSYGFDPADYLSHTDIAELLGTDWDVQLNRRRPRSVPNGAAQQHTHDDVVSARRLQ